MDFIEHLLICQRDFLLCQSHSPRYEGFYPISAAHRTSRGMYVPKISNCRIHFRALDKELTMKLSSTYQELYQELKKAAPYHLITEYPVDVVTLPFISETQGILPRNPKKGHRETRQYFPLPDAYIRENQEFSYHIFLPRGKVRHDHAILVLHGLNEKSWKKYLPWALSLTLKTGSPVILFPMAFHMNRAPSSWSQPRMMQKLTEIRSMLIRELSASTFINAALSHRLDNMPHRFYLSGYQSAIDMFKLIRSIKHGLHPYFNPDARIDLFAYSIGAFLAQNMLIADDDQLLKDSRVVLFCGGSVFEDMDGESKLIMDSSAFRKLVNYFVHDLETDIAGSRAYTHLLKNSSLGRAFRSMIGKDLNREIRETVFRTHADRIKVIGLKDDSVIPSDKIVDTMRGAKGDIQSSIEILDLPYRYSHEIPFPVGKNGNDAVIDRSFDKIFSKSADFLC